jgi:steroid 5-alpha reductase family enzyme
MNCVLECVKSLFSQHYFPKVLISQTIFWAVASFGLKNPTLVDVAWGANHFLIGYSVYAANGFKASSLGFGILALWFARLSGFLFYNRIWNRHVDPRYEALRKNRNEIIYYFYQFQIQGILLTFTSIPLYFAFQQRNLHFLNYVGIILCLAGIVGESIADQQLQNYKNNRTSNSGIFREGLFKYSRHPNLFFEFVFWTGMAIYSVNPANYCSIVAFLGPLLLYLIVRYITVGITTKHMLKSKPEFKKVMEETNMFWPFSPKH